MCATSGPEGLGGSDTDAAPRRLCPLCRLEATSQQLQALRAACAEPHEPQPQPQPHEPPGPAAQPSMLKGGNGEAAGGQVDPGAMAAARAAGGEDGGEVPNEGCSGAAGGDGGWAAGCASGPESLLDERDAELAALLWPGARATDLLRAARADPAAYQRRLAQLAAPLAAAQLLAAHARARGGWRGGPEGVPPMGAAGGPRHEAMVAAVEAVVHGRAEDALAVRGAGEGTRGPAVAPTLGDLGSPA